MAGSSRRPARESVGSRGGKLSERLRIFRGMITTLAVRGFRSLRDVVLPLGPVTVVTGANGVGKSNLYRAFQLLSDTASGQFVASLARVGGLGSVLWAGPEDVSKAMLRGEQPVQGTGSRRSPISLALGFQTGELGYLIDIGLPQPSRSMFDRDPEIKREHVWAGPVLRPAAALVERKRLAVRVREDDGWAELGFQVSPVVGLLDELSDPIGYPEVHELRRLVRRWRFYDSFRVDSQAPARLPRVGTRTEVLAADGHDLAPAVQTILESAWAEVFTQTVADALPGSSVGVVEAGGRFELALTQPGMLRPLSGLELSDGTLRFLLLAAALLSPRPPGLLVINEPETSLHPGVVDVVAELVVRSAERSQVVVVTHSGVLADRLERAGALRHELAKRLGETYLPEQGLLTKPQWNWGKR